ncbi:MAG: class II glutamine amidotransferase, partial [Pirellulales bacterium]
MCGIVGYVGSREAGRFVLEGLRRLEYRGYDSSGVAAIDAFGTLKVTKATGRVDNLIERLADSPVAGSISIGHTRWATHGRPSDVNAHPHVGGNNELVIVHNGVIENYQQIRDRLIAQGYVFRSATDTEVIAHLISSCLDQVTATDQSADGADPYAPLVHAVQSAVAQLRGSYGIVVLFRDRADVLIAARLGSPLVVGVGEGEHFIASDASPMAG